MRIGLISLAVLIPIFIVFSAIGKKMKMENRDIFVAIGYSLICGIICGILSFIFISFISESSEGENDELRDRIEELEANCAKGYRQ